MFTFAAGYDNFGPLTLILNCHKLTVPVHNIYINICLEWCQYVTDREVVVTLAAVEQQNFRLSDPNKDHNPYILLY